MGRRMRIPNLFGLAENVRSLKERGNMPQLPLGKGYHKKTVPRPESGGVHRTGVSEILQVLASGVLSHKKR